MVNKDQFAIAHTHSTQLMSVGSLLFCCVNKAGSVIHRGIIILYSGMVTNAEEEKRECGQFGASVSSISFFYFWMMMTMMALTFLFLDLFTLIFPSRDEPDDDESLNRVLMRRTSPGSLYLLL